MERSRQKIIWHIIAVVLAAVAFEVFLLLCLRHFRAAWVPPLFYLAAIGGSVLNAALLAGEITAFLFKKEVVYKSCIIAYVLLVFAAVLFYILLETGFMEIVRDSEKLEDYLERSGVWMVPLFITLQFLQVVILPIPSTVTVAVGSALFGPFLGGVYSLVGILLGSLAAFLIGRYAGYRVVAWLVGESTLKKWLKRLKGKDKLLLSFMFLLPVFPDDVLCFVAGLSTMSFLFFFIVILVARILGIFATSYLFSWIPFTTWWGILIWCAIGAVIVVLFTILYKKSEEIEKWFMKKLHRETRIEEKTEKDEFTIDVIDPDGAIVSKGVKKGEKKE